ncbi:alpha-D-ribose 1-methylphosphonate 5-triphosphate diphosphatase, partial [Rhizobium johnstonii]
MLLSNFTLVLPNEVVSEGSVRVEGGAIAVEINEARHQQPPAAIDRSTGDRLRPDLGDG